MISCLIVTVARSSRRVSNLAVLLSSIHLLCTSNSVTAFQSQRHTTLQRNSSPKQSRPTALFSNSFPEENGGRRQAPSSKLSAVAIGTDVDRRLPVDYRGIQTVITTSLLITGNTIGAAALVLPEMAAKPGLAVSTGLFLGNDATRVGIDQRKRDPSQSWILTLISTSSSQLLSCLRCQFDLWPRDCRSCH
jgi:hypothetical protein